MNSAGRDTKATSHVDRSEADTSSNKSEFVGEWCEATTPEGYIYYWNTVTKGETFCFSIFCDNYVNTVLGFC